MKVKSESEVAQLCLTPSDPTDCSLPGSSVHGILQARVLEWGAIDFSWLPLLMNYCLILLELCLESSNVNRRYGVSWTSQHALSVF